MSLRIGCLQMCSGPDVDDNLKFIDQQLKLAAQKGVELVQLPENFAQMPLSAKNQVIEVDSTGAIQDFLRAAAKRYKLALIAGAIPIKEHAGSDANPVARCLLIDSNGGVVSRYDKIHLFNVQLPDGKHYRESDRFSPANSLAENLRVSEVAGVQLGLSICYDLRFPEMYRLLTEKGAELISVPSAFTYETGRAHWATLLKARAIENLCFVFAAAQTGEHASGRRTWGHSMIISPWGEVLAQADEEPGLIYADINLTELQQLRAQFPALNHRRI